MRTISEDSVVAARAYEALHVPALFGQWCGPVLDAARTGAGGVQALREMLRVLQPGGRIAVAVWDSLENSPAYPVEVEILRRIGGKRAAD
ncbi:MAG: hypothetical protein RQ826_13350, partial [Xanthomonadales bacterium]|nr:hypothetical protein [Xanthomonadales bacterium]